MALTGPSKKKQKLSKNKKKSWGKTDITDVEDYLESVRIQERTGYVAASSMLCDKTDIENSMQIDTCAINKVDPEIYGFT